MFDEIYIKKNIVIAFSYVRFLSLLNTREKEKKRYLIKHKS